MTMQRKFAALGAVVSGVGLALLLAPLPASAHHGWGGNVREESDMTGTVVQGVSLRGPHATMKVDVQGVVWDITLAPPFRTQRAGLQEGTIPVGATVTLHGNVNRDQNRHEMKTVSVRYGEKKYAVYPERE